MFTRSAVLELLLQFPSMLSVTGNFATSSVQNLQASPAQDLYGYYPSIL